MISYVSGITMFVNILITVHATAWKHVVSDQLPVMKHPGYKVFQQKLYYGHYSQWLGD